MVTPAEELRLLLRPAGGGLYTVSTGRREQVDFQCAWYGATGEASVERAWIKALSGLASARAAILGVPSDSGAGLMRGAAFGPQALRDALLEQVPDFAMWASRQAVIDVGDVRCVPQLLHDDMLSEAQKDSSRAALFPSVSAGGGRPGGSLPVSPLSIAERVMQLVLLINPRLRVFVLGGDHSVAWPVVNVLASRVAAGGAPPFAIVQPDAHTDLLPERLGVKYCFATWAYHANALLGKAGHLVQVGIRASGRTKEHWEKTLGVKQFWAADVQARGEAAAITDIVAYLRGLGVRDVYFSNDIDGTDSAAAPSTGAPEPGGLSAGFVRGLIERLGSEFSMIGADLVEVAPYIGGADDRRQTLAVGAQYAWASLQALVRPG